MPKEENIKINIMHSKRRRGRPRLENIYREPNGQRSRAKDPIQKLALEVRARMTGLKLEQAKDPRSGTHLGRLAMLNEQQPGAGISLKQYDAISKYLELLNDYKKVLCSPGAYWDKSAVTTSNSEEGYIEWCNKVKRHHKQANAAIYEGQRQNPHAKFSIVLRYIVLRDIEMPRYLGDLRLLCNILYKHFYPQKKRPQKNNIYWSSLAGK